MREAERGTRGRPFPLNIHRKGACKQIGKHKGPQAAILCYSWALHCVATFGQVWVSVGTFGWRKFLVAVSEAVMAIHVILHGGIMLCIETCFAFGLAGWITALRHWVLGTELVRLISEIHIEVWEMRYA